MFRQSQQSSPPSASVYSVSQQRSTHFDSLRAPSLPGVLAHNYQSRFFHTEPRGREHVWTPLPQSATLTQVNVHPVNTISEEAAAVYMAYGHLNGPATVTGSPPTRTSSNSGRRQQMVAGQASSDTRRSIERPFDLPAHSSPLVPSAGPPHSFPGTPPNPFSPNDYAQRPTSSSSGFGQSGDNRSGHDGKKSFNGRKFQRNFSAQNNGKFGGGVGANVDISTTSPTKTDNNKGKSSYTTRMDANFMDSTDRQRAEIGRMRAFAKRKKKRDAEQKRVDFRGFDPNELISSSDEDELCHGGGQILNRVVDDEEILTEEILLDKYERDKRMVRDALIAKLGENRSKLKDIRFLMASAQTYGNLDGCTCMMAEYAMNEFNFRDGVIDRFSTLVGPWQIENEIQKQRAEFHANDTHRIPLHNEKCRITKRQLIAEILGRTEPMIAREQGVRVGLYTNKAEAEDTTLRQLSRNNDNPYHLLDGKKRRWIIVLKQEYTNMLLASTTLAKSIGLEYEGFPTQPDRYVLCEAFVDAISEVMDVAPHEDFSDWIASLGQHLPKDFCTPWERSGELFCERHRGERNSCCALVTVSRAAFIILHSLAVLQE